MWQTFLKTFCFHYLLGVKKSWLQKTWHIFSKFFFSLYTWSQKLLTAKTETFFVINRWQRLITVHRRHSKRHTPISRLISENQCLPTSNQTSPLFSESNRIRIKLHELYAENFTPKAFALGDLAPETWHCIPFFICWQHEPTDVLIGK